MLRFFFISVLLSSLCSCQNKTPGTEGESKTVNVNSELNVATRTARKTFPQFKLAFISHRYDSTGFAIKIKFPTANGGAEHFWTSKLSYHDDAFWGAIDETPIDTSIKIRIGEVFKIDTNTISDWEYINDRYLVGAYTTRVLRKHMSPEEGRKFDSTWAKLMYN